MRNPEPYPKDSWVFVQARKLLELLGYDTSKDIHTQFLERHGEALKNIKKDERKSSSSTKK